MGFYWPLPEGTTITQEYGTNPESPYNPPGGHTGTDFAVNIGTPVRAPGDGIIAFIGTSDTPNGSDNLWWVTPFGGNYLALDCGALSPTFIFAHLLRFNVVAGQHVKAGDIIAYTGNSGTATSGPHLHFEALAPFYNLNSSTYGRSNPRNFCTNYWGGGAATPAANQRRAGNYAVNQRSAPNASAKVVRTIDAGALEVFKGYVRGEKITVGGQTSDLWLVDQYGYCSVLLFDPTNVAGLTDLTPKPAPKPSAPAIKPFQRVTADGGAQGRAAADKNAAEKGERFAGDLILDFKGFVKTGTPPYPGTTDVWFVSISGWYFWAGAFVDEGTHDLPDLTVHPSVPAPPVPAVKPYSFTPDIEVVNGIKVEAIPANITNVEPGNFPAKPTCIVKHHWGTPPIAITSVIGEFQRKEAFKSANFVITDTRIVQMVKLGDRPYHAGPAGNVMVGFEIDPRGYEKDATGKYTAVALKIQENVRALHVAVNKFYGYSLDHMLHKDVPGNSTQCSPFDLSTLAPVPVNAPVQPAPAPAPDKPPVVVPPVTKPVTPAPVTDERKLLIDFATFIVDQYLNTKNK